MNHGFKLAVALSFGALLFQTHLMSSSFICQEPGGKRLVQIDGKEVSRPGGKMLIYIDGNDLLKEDIHAKAFLVVDDVDVRPSVAGVRIANFDGADIRHGASSNGKVLMNYQHPNLCPSFRDNRIYSIEGDALTKQQLVAVLYLLKPQLFKLSAEEIAAQQKAIREAGAESDRLAAADHAAGKWELLNGHGPVEKVGSGLFTVGAKKGDVSLQQRDTHRGDPGAWNGGFQLSVPDPGDGFARQLGREHFPE